MSKLAGHQHPSIFSERPILTGVAVGVVSLLPHFFMTPEASLGFAAILIALIAGIYFGFAYLAHACWDFAHHNRARLSLVAIPQWYVPWCVVIDVVVGAGLLVLWRSHGLI